MKKIGKFSYKIFIISLVILNSCSNSNKKTTSSVIDALSSTEDTSKFAKADKIRTFKFPEDYGAHNNFQTEWWYYTGNLNDEKNNHYGFQLTFFRRALSVEKIKRKSKWATNQIYFAHFTVSDIKNNKFYFAEKYSRGIDNLSGVKVNPFSVYIENWSAMENGNKVNLKAENEPVKIDLNISPLKHLVLQGEHGLSHKSADNASYYYSQTRLKTQGKISINKQTFNVNGLSWLDREWSTSALSKKQTGWDWFSIQLDDKREIMLYQLRLKNGGIDDFSSGSIIEESGKLISLKKDDFKIKVLEHWKSPDTNVTYPSKWQVDLPKYNISMIITPYINNQELDLSLAYWEGAVKVSGNVTGNGYVELTGYNESLIQKQPVLQR